VRVFVLHCLQLISVARPRLRPFGRSWRFVYPASGPSAVFGEQIPAVVEIEYRSQELEVGIFGIALVFPSDRPSALVIVDVLDAGLVVFGLHADKTILGVPRVSILVVFNEIAVEIVLDHNRRRSRRWTTKP